MVLSKRNSNKLKSLKVTKKHGCVGGGVVCDVVCDVCVMLCGGMFDFKLLGGFDNRQTNEQTDKRTFVLLESLLRMKKLKTDLHRPSTCSSKQG